MKSALLGLAAAALLVGLAAIPAGASTRATLLCQPNQHILVHNGRGEAFYVRNPYWHGIGKTCIRNRDRMANFRVRRVTRPDGSGKVNGYPDIMTGCIWHICTPHTNMPVRAERIGSLHSTWHTREGVPGIWNASYDLWLGKHRRNANGSATRNGAELMIWLNASFRISARRTAAGVRIDGRRWYLLHWRTCDLRLGVCWNYVAFHLVHPRWSVNKLDLRAFMRYCIRHHHLIRPRWWLQSVGAGFEIWRGGRGLATTAFGTSLRVGG